MVDKNLGCTRCRQSKQQFPGATIGCRRAARVRVTTGLGQLFIEMIEDGAAVEHAGQRIVGGLVSQGFAAFNQRRLHFDHAESDIDPGPEFPGVKGLAEIIVGRYTFRRP